jgi:hypothetical protein
MMILGGQESIDFDIVGGQCPRPAPQRRKGIGIADGDKDRRVGDRDIWRHRYLCYARILGVETRPKTVCMKSVKGSLDATRIVATSQWRYIFWNGMTSSSRATEALTLRVLAGAISLV